MEMNDMKRHIIVCSFILVLIILFFFTHKQIYRIYLMNQIKNDIINDLNGKFGKRTSEITKSDYYIFNQPIEELNRYDINDLINKYIEIVKDAIEFKRGNKDISEKCLGYEQINNPREIRWGQDVLMSYDAIMEAVAKNLTQQDIINYESGLFNELLIEKLKNCLDYQEKDGKIEWQINSIKDERIELPYDSYIDYVAYHREKNEDFKKAVNVIYDKDFELEKNHSYVIIEYETPIGELKKQKSSIFFDKNSYTYRVSLYDGLILNHADTYAKAHLSNHTFDKMEEEADKAYYEFMAPYIN